MKRGFTLIEMLMAMGIIGLLLASVASVALLAGRAMPTPEEEARSPHASRELAARVLDDLQLAQSFSGVTPTSITAALADQNEDGSAETVSWSWSGSPDDTLSRYWNGAEEKIPGVTDFQLTLFARSVEEDVPFVEAPAPLRTLARYTFDLQDTHTVTGLATISQYVLPVLAAGTTQWRPSRLDLFLKSDGSLNGIVGVNIRAMSTASALTGSTSGSTIASFTIPESSLSAAGTWVTSTFSASRELLPDEALAVEISSVGPGNACSVPFTKGSIPAAVGSVRTVSLLLLSTHYTAGSIAFRLYGSETLPTSTTVTSTVVVRAQATLALSGSSTSTSRSLAARPPASLSSAVVLEGP